MKKNLHIVDTTWARGLQLKTKIFDFSLFAGLIQESRRAGITHFEMALFDEDLDSVKNRHLLQALEIVSQDFTELYRQLAFPANFFSDEKFQAWLPHFEAGRVYLQPSEIESYRELFATLRKNKKTLLAMLGQDHDSSPEKLAEAAKQLQDCGVEILYLIDNFGNFNSSELRKYLETIRAAVKLPLGFQGRNTLGLAVENSLIAWDSGFEYLDASILGIGRGGGGTNLEVLAHWLKEQGLLAEVSMSILNSVAKNFAFPLFSKIPYSREIDLLLAQYKMEFFSEDILVGIADILELGLADLLEEIRKVRPGISRIEPKDLQSVLSLQNLDYSVVVRYLETGEI